MTKPLVPINDKLSAYVARPGGAGPFPGVVVFMEAFGLKQHIQQVCDELAGSGVVAVAPDIYHGHHYDYGNRDDAVGHMRRLEDAVVMDETGATLDWLDGQPDVDRERVGVMGFCMGGRLAFLAAARHGPRVHAALCFYGGAIAPEGEDRFGRKPPIDAAADIQGPVFLGYGADDRSIGAAEHARIAATLTELKKRYSLAVYPDAGHGFLCEERPSYAPAAAARAWPEAMDFLNRELVDRPPG